MFQRLSLIPLIFVCFLPNQYLHAATESNSPESSDIINLVVIDSYLEIHSGPGRGYPITNTMEQGEDIYVLARRGNWYKVANKYDRQGWIRQEELARTLAPSGLPAALPETQHGDFLAQQFRVGFTLGQQDDAETASLVAGFRLLSFIGAEFEYGEIFGTTIDGTSFGANLILEPIKYWSFTPFLSIGSGQQVWQQKEKLSIGSNTTFDNEYRFWGGGINYYIGYNFVVRGEYRKLSLIGDNDSLRSSAWKIGFSSFF